MKKIITALATLSLLLVISLFSLNSKAMSEENTAPATLPDLPKGHQQITLGAGCFWCVEAVLEQLDGIDSVTSGYMGGTNPNPTYKDVCYNNSGEIEVVHVIYDPAKLTTAKLLEWFWKLHDPTQTNGQGGDIGPQYKSYIFYYTDTQKAAAEKSKADAQKHFHKPIATNIKKATTFHPAEVYHQDYYRLNKNKNPYCRAVITPKLNKLHLQQ